MRSFYTIYRCSWTFYNVLHLSTHAPNVHMTLLWVFSSYRDWALIASHSTQSFTWSPSWAPLLSHLTIDGLTYSVSSKDHGNSCIMLDAGPNGSLFPARLDYIVELWNDDNILTLIAVQQYQPFPRWDDPFAPFPLLQTQLLMSELESLELYTIDKIWSHFALFSLVYKEKDVIVAVSLYRVSSSINLANLSWYTAGKELGIWSCDV